MTAFEDLPLAEQHALNEAAAWRARLKTDPSLELSDAFQAWSALRDNRNAFDAILHSEEALAAMRMSSELQELRRQSLQHARNFRKRRWLNRRALMRYAAGLTGIGIFGGSGAWYYLKAPTTYSTDTGMRRKITLADGSRVSLDSNTSIRVSFSDTARKIDLDHGQARFDVAHDKARPFSVTAGDETVVAVGTSFNVEKLQQKVLVTLIQGSIVVKNDIAGTSASSSIARLAPVSLDAGEELEAVTDTEPVIKKANIEATVAWVSGQLIFRDTRLADAVERENRYTDNPMIASPEVAEIRINGVFNAGDIASFVNAVTTLFPVQATTNTDDQIVLVPKN